MRKMKIFLPITPLLLVLCVNIGVIHYLSASDVQSNITTLSDIEMNDYMDIPDIPTEISLVNSTYSSIILRWSEEDMTYYPEQNLTYRIKYKSQWDTNNKRWNIVYLNNIHTKTLLNPIKVALFPVFYWRDDEYFYINVTELKYPFTSYEFCVFARFSNALYENQWSVPGSIIVKTKATAPKRPPRLDLGSFENEPSYYNSEYTRSIIIYWKNIPNNEKNGEHFKYRVFCTPYKNENKNNVIVRNETRTNHIKFENLAMNNVYKFSVYSANEIGMSNEFSTILVPAISSYDNLLSLKQMVVDKKHGIYELTWTNSAENLLFYHNHLNFYTLFWCEFERHHPDHCNGHFNWTHVAWTESSHNVTVRYPEKDFKFAISADSRSSLRTGDNTYETISTSTGMIWESCNKLPNSTKDKMESVWIGYISSTFFQLMWTLECVEHMGNIVGYRMYHCPAISINNTDCAEPMINKTVTGGLIHRKRTFAFIRDLQPYTTYIVRITMITEHGETLPSDPMIETTDEAAPDGRPMVINFSNITQSSVDLQWLPPKMKNGIIRHYIITYYMERNEDEYDEIEDTTDIFSELQPMKFTVTVLGNNYQLNYLEAYRTYVFTLVACTSMCSESSYPFRILTKVGNPTVVINPIAKYENSSSILISWSKPIVPAGPINKYKIFMVHYVGTNSTVMEKYRFTPTHLIPSGKRPLNPIILLRTTNDTQLQVKIPDCAEPKYSPQSCFVAIQAINDNELNISKPFYGDWSTTKLITCGM